MMNEKRTINTRKTHACDLIRRQDAIDVCMKYNGQGRIWSCIMGDIEKLPSVEPERKMSRWGCTLIEGRIMCLNCGTRYDWDSQAQYYKYCPNCGSRMMEANQDE